MPTEFRRCDAAQPPARDLIAATLAEYEATMTTIAAGAPSATPQDFSPPGGAYLVGFVDGIAACGGGIKAIAADTAEIKRMYVTPAHRRRGLARELLAALEDAARELGHRTVCLDCRLTTWPIYESSGFTPIPDYNGNPNAQVWARKPL